MQPEQLGPFRIGRVIGRGGMGAVYEGIHTTTTETAAVKVLLAALDEAKALEGPVVLLAKTTKGKGVSFMENIAAWHGLAPDKAQTAQALAELRG